MVKAARQQFQQEKIRDAQRLVSGADLRFEDIHSVFSRVRSYFNRGGVSGRLPKRNSWQPHADQTGAIDTHRIRQIMPSQPTAGTLTMHVRHHSLHRRTTQCFEFEAPEF